MSIVSEYPPAPPTPWKVRNMISSFMAFAPPHAPENTVNIVIAAIRAIFLLIISLSLDQNIMNPM